MAAMTSLPLLPMRPLFFPKIWGGRRIAALGKKGVPDGDVGESWEVADLPEGKSVVAAGPCEGKTLADLAGPTLNGRHARFPLLVKIVDAATDLSVQVHPGPPDPRSKDESWIVLAAEPGASVFHGLNDGVDRAAFEAALRGKRVVDVLRRVPVAPGDVLRVAPGTIHAILGGVTVLEVQEPSDTTFRVWDYERLENGKPRALHVDDALAVGEFGAQPRPKEPARRAGAGEGGAHVDVVVECAAYSARRATLPPGGRVVVDVDPSSPLVLFGLAGATRVEHDTGAVVVENAASVVVPATARRVVLTPVGGASTTAILAA